MRSGSPGARGSWRPAWPGAAGQRASAGTSRRARAAGTERRFEKFDLLRDAVLKNAEILGFQVLHVLSFFVFHDHVRRDQARFEPDRFILFLLPLLVLL